MKIYNTLTRQKEDFEPIKENQVKMYACGVTVYDLCHIGHACQAIIYDIIRKYFQYKGFDVTYVRNYTDVDDKIINKAKSLGISALTHAQNMIDEAEKDMASLEIKPADITARVTENMDEIIKFVQGLIGKDYAYAALNGDVYYKVRKFKDYGKLSNRNIDELEHGVRIDVNEQKEDVLDFALWKSAKEGEISWDSPWGKGRPGWHIECSAMSIKYLGETFDIHGGGKDLIFPHHENEIAQSEALTGKPFANYWIHNGLVTINGQKMSKSLGNFITIKDAVKDFNAEVIRFVIISNTYSSNIDFNDDTFTNAEKRMYYFYQTLNRVKQFVENNSAENGNNSNIQLVDSIIPQFVEAMDDNFNTALAVGNLSVVFKYLNDLLANNKVSLNDKAFTLDSIISKITEIADIVGLFKQEPDKFVTEIKEKYIKLKNINVSEVEGLIEKRLQAKLNKDYAASDEIRDKLISMGIAIKDIGTVTQWDLKDLV